MDRGEIVTPEERDEILNWVCERYRHPSYNLYEGRLNIVVDSEDSEVPPAVGAIRTRLLEREGLQDYVKEQEYNDFINVIKPGGSLHLHNDKNIGNLIHTRFNVLLLLPKGPIYTYYRGIRAEEKERHYIVSRSGLDYHWSDTNTSNTPRISISFGFMLPQEKLDSIVKPLPTTLFYMLVLAYITLERWSGEITGPVRRFVYKGWHFLQKVVQGGWGRS